MRGFSQYTQCWLLPQTVFEITFTSLLLLFIKCFHVYSQQTGYVESHNIILELIPEHIIKLISRIIDLGF